MGQSLDAILAECLEAVARGQRTVEDCLALYPESAERLEPRLRLALLLRQTYDAQGPQPDFQGEARQRFLSAAQAPKATPAPSFRARLSGAVSAFQWRLRPSTMIMRPALAMLLAVVLAFVGFSSFVAATAGDSLPGDWRYPVKRFGEEVRLSFTFGDNARRDYRISLAEERLNEVQQLASNDRPISESVLQEIVDTTQPLVQALEPDSVPQDQIARITDLTAKQQDVLGEVAPLVETNAADELHQAMVVSSEGHQAAVVALALAESNSADQGLALAESNSADQGPSAEKTPAAGATATSTPGAAGTPSGTATPGAAAAAGSSPTGTPSPAATSTPGSAVVGTLTPTPEGVAESTSTPTTEPTPTPPIMRVVPLRDDTTGGITWSLVTIGDFSVRVPAPEENAWVVSYLQPGQENEIVFVGHRSGIRFDAVITISIATGQTSVSALANGTLLTVKPEEVAELVPALNDIILHIVDSANAGS